MRPDPVYILLMLIGMLALPSCSKPRPAPDDPNVTWDSVDSLGGFVPSRSVARQAEPQSVSMAAASVGDSSQYTVSYVLSKPLRTSTNNGPDTAKIMFRRDSTAGVPRLVFGSKNRFKQQDSGVWKVPKVYGMVAKYTGCVWVQKNSAGPSKCASFTTNIPAPADTMPPVVDSIKVDSSLAQVGMILVPPTATLAQSWIAPADSAHPNLTGAKRQTCVFLVALDGKARMIQSQQALTDCRAAYDRLPINQRLSGYPVAYRKAG